MMCNVLDVFQVCGRSCSVYLGSDSDDHASRAKLTLLILILMCDHPSGETLAVACNEGYRAATTSTFPFASAPTQHAMTCEDDQDGGECALRSTGGVECREVRCADLSFANSRGQGTYQVLLHSSQPTRVICNTGSVALCFKRFAPRCFPRHSAVSRH